MNGAPVQVVVTMTDLDRQIAQLRAALTLHFAYYNFCKKHSAVRATPAMAAGITNRPWSIGELLSG
jgi:hypothetical protein